MALFTLPTCANGLYPTTWTELLGFGCNPSAANVWTSENTPQWAYSTSAKQEMSAFNPPPAPPAVKPPADITTPPTSGAQADQTITDVLSRQMTDWQSQNQQVFDKQPYVPAADSQSVTTWLLIAAAVLAVLLILEQRR